MLYYNSYANLNSVSDVKELTVNELNFIFNKLSPKDRLSEIYKYFDPSEILFTSSFGTNSAYLLFLLSQVNKDQEVHFINTGYLFDETIAYKDKLENTFGLNIVEIYPKQEEHNLTTEENWWIDHPKMCCAINKIAPLEEIKKEKKVWVSGVLSFQTEFRSNLDIFAEHGRIIKFHPILDVEEAELLYKVGYHQLPEHPLAEQGFGSVGCTHCTAKGEKREGRWANKEKTECGLHTHYFNEKNVLNESK